MPSYCELLTEKPSIQKFIASLLLVLFNISFVTKSIFHDLIASHTDAVSCDHPVKKTACAHQQGFKCSFNDLVVTAPYLSFGSGFILPEAVVYSSFVIVSGSQALPQQFFGTESRGPPAMLA